MTEDRLKTAIETIGYQADTIDKQKEEIKQLNEIKDDFNSQLVTTILKNTALNKRIAELEKAFNDSAYQFNEAIKMLARWCLAVEIKGSGWDDWGEHYKNASWRPGPLRCQLDAAIAAERKALEGKELTIR
jgi:hypothetical protein